GSRRRCRVGRVAVPVLIGFGYLVRRAQYAVDDVVDVSKIARMTAVVEDLDGLACENFLGEAKERHVRPAPRSVDGEEAQARHRKPIEMRVSVCSEFVRFL